MHQLVALLYRTKFPKHARSKADSLQDVLSDLQHSSIAARTKESLPTLERVACTVRNANWVLAPFVLDMRAIYERLRDDPTMHDAGYTPPFSDFNIVIDNFGAPVNMTVPKAEARIKFRYSARIDPAPIVAAVREAATRHGLDLVIAAEGPPPELPLDHPWLRQCVDMLGRAATTAPYGTDAAELQPIAPCVILGPGDVAVAHRPAETVEIAQLVAAVEVFKKLAVQQGAL